MAAPCGMLGLLQGTFCSDGVPASLLPPTILPYCSAAAHAALRPGPGSSICFCFSARTKIRCCAGRRRCADFAEPHASSLSCTICVCRAACRLSISEFAEHKVWDVRRVRRGAVPSPLRRTSAAAPDATLSSCNSQPCQDCTDVAIAHCGAAGGTGVRLGRPRRRFALMAQFGQHLAGTVYFHSNSRS